MSQIPDHLRHLHKMNYGCGFDKRDGYLNVDMDPHCSPDLLIQNMDFSAIPKFHFEEIAAMDVLEHIPRAQTLSAMLDWAEFMKPGGKLVIQTSSVLGIARLLERSNKYADHHGYTIFLFGNQIHPGDFHHTGFTETTLTAHLVGAGFAPSKIITRDRWLFYTESQKLHDWTELSRRADLSDDEFITEAYRNALGRDADPDGRTFLGANLVGGWTRRDALRHLYQAPERLFQAARTVGL